MKIGILSDIHGNYEAVCAVFEHFEKLNADFIYCLGDLVGYGPEPDMCVEKAFEKCEKIVMGNHDMVCTGKIGIERFNDHTRESVLWTKNTISEKTVSLLKQMPLIHFGHTMTFVHSSCAEPESFQYVENESDAAAAFNSLKTSICFIGHSHIPEAYIKNRQGRIERTIINPMNIEFDCRYIINAGSVGQPRDGNTAACCGLLDTEKRVYTLYRIKYDYEKVQKKILDAGLPPYLASRLSLGL